jgi:hypothetical protein
MPELSLLPGANRTSQLQTLTSEFDPELTSPTCGTYSHEITKAKAMRVVAFAREHRHPLQCAIELKCRPSESCFCALLRSGGRHRLIVGADRK